MTDADLGMATIVYDHPDEGTIEETVENEHVAYFQDHWILKRDEDDSGNDLVRRIPKSRVYYVERNVEAFEEEVKTLRDQVESFANDLRAKLPGREGTAGTTGDEKPVEIAVEPDDGSDDDAGFDEGQTTK